MVANNTVNFSTNISLQCSGENVKFNARQNKTKNKKKGYCHP